MARHAPSRRSRLRMRARSRSSMSLLLVGWSDDLAPQDPDPLDLALDHVARLQEDLGLAEHAHSARRPGGDHVSRDERVDRREVLDEERHVEDELRRARALTLLAVHAALDREVRRI